MQREKLTAQLDKFFTICQRLCDNEQADVANELPEDTLVICYYGTDPHGNKMFYKKEDMVVPVFAYLPFCRTSCFHVGQCRNSI